MPRTLLLLLLIPASLYAQRVSFGVKSGIVPTNGFPTRSSTITEESKWYTVGPSIEVRLPREFSIEVDALYRRIGYSAFVNTTDFEYNVRERANQWEIPALLKYRLLPNRSARPFVSGGYAARFTRGEVALATYRSPAPNVPARQRYDSAKTTTHGAVFGAGVEFKVGKLRLSPEVRYTYWNRAITGRDSQHQAQILLGISWP